MVDLGRIAAPCGVAAFLGIGLLMTRDPNGAGLVLVVVAVAGAVAAAWRPLTGGVLVGALTPTVLAASVLGSQQSANLAWMTVCIVAGWVTLTSPIVASVITAAAILGALGVQAILLPSEPGWFAWAAGVTFTVAACSAAVRLRETNEALEAAQAELAERSRSEERTRIAGEVHDVIGHALTVSILHIESARLCLDDDLEAARAGLEQAEALTRRSLDEVRATVTGMQRADAPLPGSVDLAADLAALAASFNAAGSRVDLQVRDRVASLPEIGAARGLAVYRIVQEALTNAARHATGETADVVVEATGAEVLIMVSNPSSGGADRLAGPAGSGVAGMRERAASVGGRLVAHRVADRWVVEGRLPA